MVPHLLLANSFASLGKVALTTQLSTLAACQVEVTPIPTCLLSSHTGGWTPFREDYSSHFSLYFKQWQNLAPNFSAVLVGYCPSVAGLKELAEFARSNHLPLFLDPILGDCGSLYQGFSQEHVKQQIELCKQAEIIFPNLTEASLLANKPYLEEDYGTEDILDLLTELAKLGPNEIVLTGVSFEKGRLGLVYYDVQKKMMTYKDRPYQEGHFFGTGDLLTAILTAVYLHTGNLVEGIDIALDTLHKSMKQTIALKRELAYGLYYEPNLAELAFYFKNLGDEI